MTPKGLTLDAGALIAFEKQKRLVYALLDEAADENRSVFVPSVVVAEVWRGGPRGARIARLLTVCRVDPLFDENARRAGEALRHVPRATTIDAIVAATAARLGTSVVTTDPDDLEPLADYFGGLTIIAV